MIQDQTFNPIIESILSQIEPAKAAIAARWMKHAERSIERITEEASGPMVIWFMQLLPKVNPHPRTGTDRIAHDLFDMHLDLFFDKQELNDPTPLRELGLSYNPIDGLDEGREVMKVLTPKTREELELMAKRYAEDQWSMYIEKMTEKFSGIDAYSVFIIGKDPLWNTLHVQAANDVEFEVQNRIVDKVSRYGVSYCQFPARFANVTKAGEPVKFSASKTAVEELTRRNE